MVAPFTRTTAINPSELDTKFDEESAARAAGLATKAGTDAYNRSSHKGTQDAASVTYQGATLTSVLDNAEALHTSIIPAVQTSLLNLAQRMQSAEDRLAVLELVPPSTSPPVITAAPTLAFTGGTADVNDTCTITQGTYSGTTVTGRTWQVYYNDVASGVPISSTTFTVTTAGTLRVIELAAYSAGVVSNPSIYHSVTDIASPPPATPVVSTPPTLAFTGGGAPDVGDTATITQGTYTGGTVTSRTGQVWVNGALYSTVADGTTGNTFTVPASAGTGSRSLRYVEIANWAGTPAVSNTSQTYTVNLPGSVPANTSLPTVTGGNIIGSTLTGSVGSWSNTPTSYKKQWKVNGANSGGLITSASTTETFDTSSLSDGDVVAFNVIATNGIGDSSASESAGFTVYADVSGVPDPATFRATGNGGSPLTDNGSGTVTAISYQTIQNLWIHVDSGTGHGINIPNGVHDVTIDNCEIGPIGVTGSSGAFNNIGVKIGAGCYNITINGCLIHDVVAGIQAYQAQSPIVITKNFCYNIRGADHPVTPYPNGQFVQFEGVSGGSNPSRIKCNVVDGDYGSICTSEDFINMYSTSGFDNSAGRIEIAYNRIRGVSKYYSYVGTPGGPLGYTPTGMIMGDGSGGGNFYVHDNVVSQVGNMGIGVAGGHDITLENNKIYMNNVASALGMGIRSYPNNTPTNSHTVSNNRIYCIDNWYQSGVPMHYEDNSNLAVESGNTFGDATLTAAIFNDVFDVAICGSSGGGGGGGGAGTVAFVASDWGVNWTTTGSGPKPAGTTTGDLMLMVATDNSYQGTHTLPSGWTQIGTKQQTSANTTTFAYKVATASEPSNYSVTFADPNNVTAIYTYRNLTGSPLNASSVTSNDSNLSSPATVSSPSVTTSAENALVVWAAVASTSANGPIIGWTVPTGYTGRGAYSNGSFVHVNVADWTKGALGSTGTVSGSFTADTGTIDTLTATIALAPSTAVTTPYVMRVEQVATGARTGDRGQGWGGHQTRHTVHSDGTERVLVIGGNLTGPGRTWTLRKRSGATWSTEASGDTYTEAMIVRHPSDDSVHVIATNSDWEPTIASSPGFTPVAIRATDWPTIESIYMGAGIGSDGTLVIKTYHDNYSPGETASTDTCYTSGTWNGSSWTFNTVVQSTIGERYTYDYILPGAYGDSSKFVGTVTRDVTKTVAGLPSLIASYVFDGLRSYSTGNTSAASWATADIDPKHTQPDPDLQNATYMWQQDAFVDTSNRLFTSHVVWDYGQTNKTLFDVRNSSTSLYEQQIDTTIGYRIFQDGQGRMWMLKFYQGTNIDVLLYPVNSTSFALGTATNLSSDFSSYSMGGERMYLAVPRGGVVIGDSVHGMFSNDSGVVYAFKIRLPD